jgi:hypothetical protein
MGSSPTGTSKFQVRYLSGTYWECWGIAELSRDTLASVFPSGGWITRGRWAINFLKLRRINCLIIPQPYFFGVWGSAIELRMESEHLTSRTPPFLWKGEISTSFVRLWKRFHCNSFFLGNFNGSNGLSDQSWSLKLSPSIGPSTSSWHKSNRMSIYKQLHFSENSVRNPGSCQSLIWQALPTSFIYPKHSVITHFI